MTTRRAAGRLWWLVGLGIAVIVVIVLAPLASPDPDGLNRVAEDTGFLSAARGALYEILPGYSIPGIDDPTLTKVASGLIGVVLVFGLALVLGRLLTARKG